MSSRHKRFKRGSVFLSLVSIKMEGDPEEPWGSGKSWGPKIGPCGTPHVSRAERDSRRPARLDLNLNV